MKKRKSKVGSERNIFKMQIKTEESSNRCSNAESAALRNRHTHINIFADAPVGVVCVCHSVLITNVFFRQETLEDGRLISFLFFFSSFISLLHSLLSSPDEPMADEETELDIQLNSSYLKALDGFLMVLSEDGDMIYLSESVNKCLGLAQVSLIYLLC